MSRQPESFAEVLRRLRTTAALSQEALSERAGLSLRGVSDLERGVRRAPRLETIRRLADALELAEDTRAELLAAGRSAVFAHDLGAGARGRVVADTFLRARPALPATPLVGRERE